MKNFKKILVLALAVMMCLTALAVPTFAATFNTEIKITARFNETGDKIIASVVTTEPAGAIQGTLTYSGLTFDEAKIDFSENNNMEKHIHNDTNKTIKFVLLANDLNGDGDTHWADFYFNVPAEGDVTFSLSDVKACDVNENLTDDAIEVAPATLTLTANELTTLGAQHRKAEGTTKAALRFGFRLDRTIDENGNHILGENKKAVRCGFILSTNGAETLEVSGFDEKTGTISEVTAGAKWYKATKCYKSEEKYMIYTAALQNIPEANWSTKVAARPFVVYFDGTEYGYELGAVVTKSYADVKDASGLLDATLGLGYK